MTSSIKKILVPVDFSDISKAAALQGAEMARLLNVQMDLLHIKDEKQENHNSPAYHQNASTQMENFKKEVQDSYGITAEGYIIPGNVVDQIIEFSKRKSVDQIVMGTHGASGYREMFIGSNAQRVVTLSDIPVLTMLDCKNESKFRNILIPIDNSIHSREKVNVTIEIAKLFNSKVHILGLVDSDANIDRDKMVIKLESVEKHVKHEKLSYVTTIEYGDNIAKTAINYSNINKCDLISINTGHESKITGIFLGPFAQQIVNHSPIPVLSVKQTEALFTTATF
ncbi:MAG: hypothetical protein K0S44_2419 [Bacteroidetes bacterium]|jgi:nucleotide-binding universal stress UspA family protein|nr:hypothetical protein [Bacteroidota bacterium]